MRFWLNCNYGGSMTAVFWPAVVAIGGACWLPGIFAGVMLAGARDPTLPFLSVGAGVIAIVGGCLRMALIGVRAAKGRDR